MNLFSCHSCEQISYHWHPLYWKIKGTYLIVKQSNSQAASGIDELRDPCKFQETPSWYILEDSYRLTVPEFEIFNVLFTGIGVLFCTNKDNNADWWLGWWSAKTDTLFVKFLNCCPPTFVWIRPTRCVQTSLQRVNAECISKCLPVFPLSSLFLRLCNTLCTWDANFWLINYIANISSQFIVFSLCSWCLSWRIFKIFNLSHITTYYI